MTKRQRLHLLVDDLSDEEVADALTYIEERRGHLHPADEDLRPDVLLVALQEEVLARVPADISLVDELLAERRREASRDAS